MQYVRPEQLENNTVSLLDIFTVDPASSDATETYRLSNAGTTIHVSTDPDENTVNFLHDVDGKIGFLVRWGCTANESTSDYPTVTVVAGSEGRAWNRDQGAVSFMIESTAAFIGKTYLVGPFESARFAIQSTSTDWPNRNEVRFTISADTCADIFAQRVNILPFKMPVVSYST